MSLTIMTAKMVEGAAAAEKLVVAMNEIVTAQQKIAAANKSENALTFESLMSGPATTAMMSAYIEALARDPSHPEIPKIKAFLRQYARIDESFFGLVDRLFKQARKATKTRSGTRLDQSVVDDVIDEIVGRS